MDDDSSFSLDNHRRGFQRLFANYSVHSKKSTALNGLCIYRENSYSYQLDTFSDALATESGHQF